MTEFIYRYFLPLRLAKLAEAREIIIEAESIARSIGASVSTVLKDVLKRINNPFIAQAVRKLEAGKPKSEAYAGIFPKDFILLLREAEKTAVVTQVFDLYAPMLKKVGDAEKRYLKLFLMPTFSAFLYTAVAYIICVQISNGAGQMLGKDFLHIAEMAKTATFIAPVLVAFVLLFFLLPPLKRINPATKKLNDFTVLVKLLTIYKVAIEAMIPVHRVLQIYAEIFPQFRYLKRIPPEKASVDTVAKLIQKFTTPVEASFLVLSTKAGSDKANKYLDFLQERKLKEFDFVVDQTTKAIGGLLGTITYLPLIPAALLFVKMLTTITNMTTQGGM